MKDGFLGGGEISCLYLETKKSGLFTKTGKLYNREAHPKNA